MRHIITYINTEGIRVRFGQDLNDQQFDEIVSELGGYLPPRFSAAHVSEQEITSRGVRVQVLGKLPIALNAIGGWADPIDALRCAQREYVEDQKWTEIDPMTDLSEFKQVFPDCWVRVEGENRITVSKRSEDRLMRKVTPITGDA